jgi:hypothetical protein
MPVPPVSISIPIHLSHCVFALLFRYVSSDFGNHPLSHLMGSVFGMHSRDEIEVRSKYFSTPGLCRSIRRSSINFCSIRVLPGVPPFDNLVVRACSFETGHCLGYAIGDP